MSKDSTTTNVTELPPELREAAIQNLELGDAIGSIGYTPYQGNTTAAMSPQQMAAMQGFDQASAAAGGPSAVDWGQQDGNNGFTAPQGMDQDALYTALTGMPPPTTDESGFSGYSPMSQYESAINQMAPGQRAAIESFVMDPTTGAAPSNPAMPDQTFQPLIPEEYARSQDELREIRAANRATEQRNAEAAAAAAEEAQQPQGVQTNNGLLEYR